MARVSWIDQNVYSIILSDDDEKILQELAAKGRAGSSLLKEFIENGLALVERTDDKKDAAEDKGE